MLRILALVFCISCLGVLAPRECEAQENTPQVTESRPHYGGPIMIAVGISTMITAFTMTPWEELDLTNWRHGLLWGSAVTTLVVGISLWAIHRRGRRTQTSSSAESQTTTVPTATAPEDIRLAMRQLLPSIRNCYHGFELATSEITLRFQVNETGRAAFDSVSPSLTTASTNCVRRIIEGHQFPRPPEGSMILVPTLRIGDETDEPSTEEPDTTARDEVIEPSDQQPNEE